jgi:hypothetical protein
MYLHIDEKAFLMIIFAGLSFFYFPLGFYKKYFILRGQVSKQKEAVLNYGWDHGLDKTAI